VSGLSSQHSAALIQAVDRVPAFKGVGIGFVGMGMSTIVRQPDLPLGMQHWIVFKEEPAATAAAALAAPPSRVGKELGSVFLSCTSAVIAGAVASGGIAAAPLTAGASAAVSALAWSSGVAAAAQCGISAGRLLNELYDPGSNERHLDSKAWYETTSLILDGISLAGGVASLGQAAKTVIQLQRASGKPILQILKGMDRASRKRLAEEVARYTGQATTRREFIRLARAGKIPKVFTRQQVTQAMIHEMLQAIGGNTSFAESFRTGNLKSLVMAFAAEE
jgi:hypothetical protein